MKLVNETKVNRNKEIKKFLYLKCDGFLADKFESARNSSGRITGKEEVSIVVSGNKVVIHQLRANSKTFHIMHAW